MSAARWLAPAGITGARFGEYLAREQSPQANDYLASDPESRPGDPEVYISQARFYAGIGRFPEAIAEFRKTLDLDPDRGEAHDGIAQALMRQGRRAEAIAEWHEALAAFQREQSKGVRVRETFWANVSGTIRSIAEARVFADVSPISTPCWPITFIATADIASMSCWCQCSKRLSGRIPVSTG